MSQTLNHGTDLQSSKVEPHHNSQYEEVPVRNLVAAATSIPASYLPATNTIKSQIHRARGRINPPIPKVNIKHRIFHVLWCTSLF